MLNNQPISYIYSLNKPACLFYNPEQCPHQETRSIPNSTTERWHEKGEGLEQVFAICNLAGSTISIILLSGNVLCLMF